MSDVRRPPKSKREVGLNFSFQKRKRDEDNAHQHDRRKSANDERSSGSQNHQDYSEYQHHQVRQCNQPSRLVSDGLYKTRILIISDTHGRPDLPRPIDDQSIGVVLHCGDLSKCGELNDCRNSISLLASIPAELKLVIPGNHDLTLDETFWAENCTSPGSHLYAEAIELWKEKTLIEARVIFLDDGLHDFTLKPGAKLTVYTSSATPQPSQVTDWAFGYSSNVDRYNHEETGIWYGESTATSHTQIANNSQTDVLMTQGPPKYMLDLDPGTGENIGCAHLFRAARRTKPRIHAFGHAHSCYGAKIVSWKDQEALPDDGDADDGIKWRATVSGKIEDKYGANWARVVEERLKAGEHTLFVNSALMGTGDRLEKLPWLVEIDLQPAD